ncbi:3-hydroxyacyl-CoA dehydrogenase family protein [Agilicoccus flavus]|uniref:3-hydroxyacyl-CoA dehydrogenase family protein n=1 Tax=Agilicoccus flavus TaxID=2775968 RepID=UPI001CF68622|nr:3-hydroxyacyl-CoA dehydrogenase family protein [Agilicoccus flavus]
MAIRTVAVVGAGYMGGGIAQCFADAGLHVTIADADAEATRASHERLLREAREFERLDLVNAGYADRVAANLHVADSIEEAVADVDMIEEVVPENPEIKASVHARIEAAARPDAVFGSNTSTIPITDMAAGLAHPERFLGVHFSNPAPFIPGVEIILHPGTDEAVARAAEEAVRATGKLTARLKDKAGFVLNRLQFTLLKEAMTIVEEGVASADDVDTIVRTTFGFRLPFFGPFVIADMAGLDTYRGGFATLEKHYGERLSCLESLAELVDSGHYGVKSGGGFVVPAEGNEALVEYRNTAYARLTRLLSDLGPAPVGRSTGAAVTEAPAEADSGERLG